MLKTLTLVSKISKLIYCLKEIWKYGKRKVFNKCRKRWEAHRHNKEPRIEISGGFTSVSSETHSQFVWKSPPCERHIHSTKRHTKCLPVIMLSFFSLLKQSSYIGK